MKIKDLFEGKDTARDLANQDLDDFIDEFDIRFNTAVAMWMSEPKRQELQKLAKAGAKFDVINKKKKLDSLKPGWEVFDQTNEDNFEALIYKK